MNFSCTNCNSIYPPTGLPYRCLNCGGIYDIRDALPFNPAKVEPSLLGICRYRHTFGLSKDFEFVSLGEGNTPLLWTEVFGHKIAFKCEFLNPSGSFKDRGSIVIVGWLQSRGIREAVEDSSGNAGASLAAYAARTGIKARIFIPESTSGPKRRQIEAYGAEMVTVSGSRTMAAKAVRLAAEGGTVYASHVYLPFNLLGYATTAYEIYEQIGNKLPGSIILPVGQGGLLLGLARGFNALRIANDIRERAPVIIGVQVKSCAPLWAMQIGNDSGIKLYTDKHTLAEGIQVSNPLRQDYILQAIDESQGYICIVDENQILPGRDALALLGFYVEPTSAIVWRAMEQTINKIPEPVVVILTGSGYKYA